jgi:predicted Na+-dependent transporter
MAKVTQACGNKGILMAKESSKQMIILMKALFCKENHMVSEFLVGRMEEFIEANMYKVKNKDKANTNI